MVEMESRLEEFCSRLDLLETQVHVLKAAGDPSKGNLVKTLRNTLVDLEADYNSLVESVEQSKAVNVELQELLDKVIARNNSLDELIENNTSQIELEQEVQKPDCELSPGVHTKQASRGKPLPPKALFKDAESVTESEFSSVPKYMLGRLQLEALNACVDAINNAMEVKYAIMGKKRSKLTSSEMKRWMDYTHEEAEIPDLKGQKFVTEKNVAAVNGQRTLDKRSLNIMTVLRYLKKIEEVRRGTAKYYLPVCPTL